MKRWQYRGVEGLVPQDIGIYEGTPVVNDAFLHHVRSGKVHYVRGSPTRLSKNGVVVSPRKGTRKQEGGKLDGDDAAIITVREGEEREIEADVVVLATGFGKPSVDFLPKGLFPEGYQVSSMSNASLGKTDAQGCRVRRDQIYTCRTFPLRIGPS